MLIFSYGSNMCLARLRGRAPSAEPRGRAVLSGHALRFHKRSVDGSGKADAFETGSDADAVWGVVYRLATHDKPGLDRAEGLGRGYDEKLVTVVAPEGRAHEVQLYVATVIDPALLPYAWYKRYVVEGARQHGLPPEYVEKLAAQPAAVDPDERRAAGHLAVECGSFPSESRAARHGRSSDHRGH